MLRILKNFAKDILQRFSLIKMSFKDGQSWKLYRGGGQ